jgi:hypothetical protein
MKARVRALRNLPGRSVHEDQFTPRSSLFRVAPLSVCLSADYVGQGGVPTGRRTKPIKPARTTAAPRRIPPRIL